MWVQEKQRWVPEGMGGRKGSGNSKKRNSLKVLLWSSSGGSGVRNPPASAGYASLIPDPGRFHMINRTSKPVSHN